MGRPAMSPEMIQKNKISIITSAMDLMRESGIQSVSARSLGSRTGMNSALIYKYFKDIDEVVLFACVHFLQDYTKDMAEAFKNYKASSEELSDAHIYMLSWEIFSRHAFNNPDQYNMLFFSKHSATLHSVISEYYKLFPHDKDSQDDAVLEGMYRTSNLSSRNLMLLIPVFEGRRSESEIILLNDLTVSFFFSLLTQLIGKDKGITADIQISRMLDACRFIIEL